MSVVDTLVKCRKYITYVSERDINDADFGLLEEIDDAIQEAEELNSIIKSLKIANEGKDMVSKKIISDAVEKRMGTKR